MLQRHTNDRFYRQAFHSMFGRHNRIFDNFSISNDFLLDTNRSWWRLSATEPYCKFIGRQSYDLDFVFFSNQSKKLFGCDVAKTEDGYSGNGVVGHYHRCFSEALDVSLVYRFVFQ